MIKKHIKKILLVLTIFIILFLILGNFFVKANFSSWAQKSFNDMKEYDPMTLLNGSLFTYTDSDDKDRRTAKYTNFLCIERYNDSARQSDVKVKAILDINMEGKGPGSYKIYTKDGIVAQSDDEDGYKEAMMRLAYIAKYAESHRGNGKMYSVATAFAYAWQDQGVRNLTGIPFPAVDSGHHNKNDIYNMANDYVKNGVDEDGNSISARILVCGYGWVQYTALLYGGPADASLVKIDKYITKVDTIDPSGESNDYGNSREGLKDTDKKKDPVKVSNIGVRIHYTIKVKNEGQSTVKGKLTDTFQTKFLSNLQYEGTAIPNDVFEIEAKQEKVFKITLDGATDVISGKYKNTATFKTTDNRTFSSSDWVKVGEDKPPTMNKYINSINYVGQGRSSFDENTKQSNPADAGDNTLEKIIEYTITIKNENSEDEITGRLTDYPDSVISITNMYKDGSIFYNGSDITLAGGQEVTLTVQARMSAGVSEGTYRNRAVFETDEYVIESSDYLKIKQPGPEATGDLHKYITKVTNSAGSFKTRDEDTEVETKYNFPAEVEKGSFVTYTIKLNENVVYQNTSDFDHDGELCEHYDEHKLDWVKCIDTYDSNYLRYDSISGPYGVTFDSSTGEIKWVDVPQNEEPDDLVELTADITFEVVASNMKLMNIENKVSNAQYHYTLYDCDLEHVYELIPTPSGGYTYGNELTDECYFVHNTTPKEGDFEGEDYDYVRLLDPEIAGVVFLDKNDNDLKDGSDENLGQVLREQYKKVSVELWNSTIDQKVDEKFVNPETGEFSFGRVRKGPDKIVTGVAHQGVNEYTNIGTGNDFYYDSETLYKYYIVYNYDGERYTAVKNAETNNLNSDYSMKPDFPNDSNADELNREEFNGRLETIANDKAFKGTVNNPANREEMEYETVDAYGNETSNLQVSTALWDGKADSVLNIKAKSIELFFPNTETEYLLHINLGIEERDHADLSLTKDVVKADVTVNGFITTYEYEKLGTDEYVANNDNTLKIPYVLRIYREDYEFRTKNYDSTLQTIMNDNNPYKDMGRDNDLQIILTYKITITNNSDDGKEAVVREVVDYCSEELEMVPGTAMLDSEDSGIEVQDGTSSKFANEVAGTNTYLYGNNLESKRLQPGESLDIYLKYRVLKDNDHYIFVDKESDEINNKKYNIAEVGAYSIYEGGKAAGLVDINSNPANSRKDDGSFDPADFEDDTFETAIAVVLRDYPDNPPPDEPNPEEPPNDPPPPENPPGNGGDKQSYRNISGVVFEEIDKKINNSDGQLVADGVKDQNDIFAKNVLVKLYEVIRGKTDDGSIVDYLVDTGMWYRTGDDGRYYFGDKVDSSLNGTSGYNSVDDRYRLHAGLYKVRFVYGDEFENLVTEDGTTIKYSGQDYQSTKYTEIGNTDDENEILEVTKFSTYGDTFTTDISTPIRSLAKDNEVRRLEVNAYSTTTTYPMDTVLKAEETTAEAQVLAEHTAMFADTKAFNMQIEHYGAYEKFGDVAEKTIDGMKTYYYSVRDIDFGLTERPKTKLQLMNDISEVRAITSDGATLLDIFFDIMYEKEQDEHGIITGIKHTAVPNMAKSKGLSQVQVLNRNGNNQGFRYANIDSDLLQGMTITIKFQIAVANTSEVDHLAGWLEEKIQERPDVDLTVDYSHLDTDLTTNVDIGSDGKLAVDTIRKETRTYDYSRSYLNRLIYEGGDIESGSVSALNSASTGIFSYADRETIGSESIKKAYTYANIKLIQPSYEVGYYLGNIYYNNEYTGDEAVVNTRVDQFIDYVDNDLIFKPEENLNENKQMTYLTYTTSEIAERGLLREITDEIKVISDGEKDYYNADVNNANNNLAFNIEDAEINPYFYKFLPTVPDEAFAYEISEVTMGYDWDKDDLDNPISPDVKVRTIGNPYNNDESYNYREDISQYLYVMDLEASRVLTSEADIEGVAVDNLAEIIKVTNTAGRKVYVKASQDATGYIGNTTKDPIETETFVELSRPETDTDFTEYVTFSPPTGLSQGQLAMRDTIEKATNVLLIGVPTIIIIAGVSYVTVQVVKRKKFYK